MDPSGIDNFDEQWRKRFQEASETPPPAVWDRIEAHLNEEDKKGTILPLWWQSPRYWFAAAAVAALLVVGGIWYSGKGNEHVQLATVESADSSRQSAPALHNPELAEGANPAVSAQPQDEILKGNSVTTSESAIASIDAGQTTRRNASSESASLAQRAAGEKSDVVSEKADHHNADILNPELASSPLPNHDSPEKPETSGDAVAAISAGDGNESMSLSELASRPYSDLDVLVQKRYVFFKAQTKTEQPAEPAKNKEYWAALGLMPASFNPDLRVKEAPLAFTNQSLSSKKSVRGTSLSGASYAVQTQGGVRLSKHWAVELGLGYLQGNSSYEGGGYVLNAYNSRSANVLENALADLSASPNIPAKSSGFVNNGALYIDVSNKVSNNYKYLQLPVQAGFTLRPDKKLSYSVLGGMMANFFLSNDLQSASGEIITTTASDEIYRSVNWAATTGLRFNYKLSTRWNANLTGSYQKAVTSGFRSNQSLDAHPWLYGVSWGMRYTF